MNDELIIQVLEAVDSAGARTIQQLIDATGAKRTSVYKRVVDLRNDGLIEGVRAESTAAHRPSVEYRITDAGIEALAQLNAQRMLEAERLLTQARKGNLRLA